MNRTRRTALLGLVTAAGVVAAGAWSEILGGSGGGFLLAAVIVVATSLGVWKGVPVPAAVLVVPLAFFATVAAGVVGYTAAGWSDGQAALVPLVPLVGGVIALLLVPVTGAVAGLTLAVRGSDRER